MKKTILMVLFMVALSSYAWADWSVGQQFTQEQINNADMMSVNLGLDWYRDNGKVIITCDNTFITCGVKYSYMTLQPLENQMYEVVQYNNTINFPLQTVIDIKNEHNASYAMDVLRTYIIRQKNNHMHGERIQLQSYQEKSPKDTSWITDNLGI